MYSSTHVTGYKKYRITNKVNRVIYKKKTIGLLSISGGVCQSSGAIGKGLPIFVAMKVVQWSGVGGLEWGNSAE